MIGKGPADLPLIGYSVGNFGKNLLLSTADITLVFVLTDLLHVPAASIGSLMLMVFLGDLIFDFGAGYLAAWASRWGFGYRRMIAVGALPCGAAFTLLYGLPALGLRNFSVLTAALLIFRATYAVVDVPHNSLLARVASDSRARGRVSGYRSLFSTIASLAIATIITPAVVGSAQSAEVGKLAALGLAAACLFCLTLWIAAWSSGKMYAASKRRSNVPITFLPKFDRPMVGMFIIALVTGFAMPMFGRMVIFYATYVLHVPTLASRVLLAVTIGQLPGVMLWTYLVRHAEKSHLLAFSYVVASVGLILFWAAGSSSMPLMGAAIVTGVGLAGVFMLPWGILADVIDVAEFRHRERRETAAFASMLVILKAGAAGGSGTIAVVLAWLGYTAGAEQSRSVRLGMQGLALGLPLGGAAIALLVLCSFSIGHQRHARIRHVLEARRRPFEPD